MSSPPSDPDSPIGRLLQDGFDLVLQGGHLYIQHLAYLSPTGVRHDGVLVLPVNDTGGQISDAIGDHTIWFTGAEPRDHLANPLGTPSHRDLGAGQATNYMLSFKPPSGSYANLYDKIAGYARILRNAAQAIDPNASSTPGARLQIVDDGLPHAYRDTNTTRAGLTALNSKFRGEVIAIIGLGGTGSYILDQVAKTWVDRILLFDGDTFENHNAYRAPGAASQEQLRAGINKAVHFANEYRRMHTGIEAHDVALTAANVHLLADATFVFLAAADAHERPAIMHWLRDHNIPFIDVGLGVTETDAGLTGLAKSTLHLPGQDWPIPAAPTSQPDDDYSSNIQVADLNALNALMAVVAWKRHMGFYATHTPACEVVFKLFLNEFRNGSGQ